MVKMILLSHYAKFTLAKKKGSVRHKLTQPKTEINTRGNTLFNENHVLKSRGVGTLILG